MSTKVFVGVAAVALLIYVTSSEAQVQFSAFHALTNGEVVLTFTNSPSYSWRVLSSPDLQAWSGLVTFPTSNLPSLVHTDSAAPFLSTRYYRVVSAGSQPVVAGDHLATELGDAVIQPRNHATFVIHWNGKMIYNDPVTSATYTGLPKADLILVTHSHSDHFSTSAIESVRRTNAIIVCPQSVYTLLTTSQKGRAVTLGYGQVTNVFGMTVEAVPAYNSNHAPPGFGNGYILTLGGRRIYISGDTGDAPEIRAISNIEVAFLCMNQPYTLTLAEATNIVRAISPKVVYPYHYRDANGSTATAALFKQRLGTQTGIEVRLSKWY